MADPFDHDMAQGGAGKRPAPIIEGTATEVSVNEAADEEARDASPASHDDDDEPEERDEASTPEDETEPERRTG
jgi:hypothetical protein